jgi:hypothetical protein
MPILDDSSWNKVSHFFKVVGGAASHVVPDVAGVVSDQMNTLPFHLLTGQTLRVAQDLQAGKAKSVPQDIIQASTGQGVIGKKLATAHDQILGPDEQPRSPVERYIAAGVRGATDSLPFLMTGNPTGVVVSGATSGVGAQAGHDIAPNSPFGPIIGAVLGAFAGGHAANVPSRISTARMIMSGASHPDYPSLVRTVLEQEGGGTLDNPKVSRKGAEGPMQVRPGTKTDPGFGIRPSDGTEADTARVGRQYLAAMLGKYKGDPEKALAAYNDGPGNIDAAIKKYGNDWYYHVPDETQKYVSKGITKVYGGPRAVSASTEGVPPMHPEDIADAMADPQAAGVETPDISESTSPDGTSDEVAMSDTEATGHDVPPEDQQSLNDSLSPESGASQSDVVDFPTQDPLADVQPMDSFHENYTPFIDQPATPANDQTAMEAQLGDTQRGLEQGQITPAEAADMGVTSDTQGPPQGPTEPPQEPPSRGSENGGGNGDGPVDPTDAVNKLTQAIKDAEPVRTEQDKLYSKELGKRVGEATQVQQYARGQSGFYAELSKLKGELPKPDFYGIGNKLSQNEIDALHNMIIDNPRLPYFAKVAARKGLEKLLGDSGGSVPTENELKILSQVFPEETIKAIESKRSTGEQINNALVNLVGIPRTIMSSFDLSAPFRQGAFMVGRKEFWNSFSGMFKQFGSERAYQAVQDEIASRPTYPLMQKANLALMDVGRDLTHREELFISNWADKIPVLGKGVRMSERAYTGFLNRLRADVFDSMVKQAKEAGLDFTEDPKFLRDTGKFINAATGRGNLGMLTQAAPALSAAFFSPRLIASRITMLNPAFYVNLHPMVRQQALKSLISFAGIALTILGLAKAGGASVDPDPRSTDFGKIKTGNTRYDILGGFQPYIRLGAQLATGETVNPDTRKVTELGGKGYKATTRLDLVERFFTGKESPVASFVTDWLRGTDITGKPFKLTDAVAQRFIPMATQDTIDAVKDQGTKGLIAAPASVFGVGVQTYKPRANTSSDKMFDSSFGNNDFAKSDFKSNF